MKAEMQKYIALEFENMRAKFELMYNSIQAIEKSLFRTESEIFSLKKKANENEEMQNLRKEPKEPESEKAKSYLSKTSLTEKVKSLAYQDFKVMTPDQIALLMTEEAKTLQPLARDLKILLYFNKHQYPEAYTKLK